MSGGSWSTIAILAMDAMSGGSWATTAILAVVARTAQAAESGSLFKDARPLFETTCFACHGPSKKKAGIDLSVYADEAAVARDRKTWQKAAEQLASGEMPPE